MASDQMATAMTRFFAYSVDYIVEVQWNNSADVSLSLIKSFPLAPYHSGKMTRVTGFSILDDQNLMFIALANGYNSHGTGVIISFDISTSPITYQKSYPVSSVPLSFFAWANSFGVGLYWTTTTFSSSSPIASTSQSSAAGGQLTLVRMDLTTSATTSLAFDTQQWFGTGCFEWGVPSSFSTKGNSKSLVDNAIVIVQPCAPGPGQHADQFFMIEIVASPNGMTVVGNLTVPDQPPVTSWPVPVDKVKAALLAMNQQPQGYGLIFMYSY